MLLSNDFVKAHHEYKRDVLRKSYQAPTTKVGKATIALVASAVAVMTALAF